MEMLAPYILLCQSPNWRSPEKQRSLSRQKAPKRDGLKEYALFPYLSKDSVAEDFPKASFDQRGERMFMDVR